MPNIHINYKKPKTCDTCRFNEIDLIKFPKLGWCTLLNEQLILTKIKKRKKDYPFNTKKKNIFKKIIKIIKEIKKCLKPKKKPKSLT